MEYFKQSLKLTLVLVVVFSVVYPLLLWTIGRAITEKSEGSPVYKNGVVVGYENIGQRFS